MSIMKREYFLRADVDTENIAYVDSFQLSQKLAYIEAVSH
jgi:hypothetical protein